MYAGVCAFECVRVRGFHRAGGVTWLNGCG